MIKTYQLRQNKNNVSHILTAPGGNTMRYNFTNGNVIMGKYPSLTLRNKYAQDLLESSDLFKTHRVVLLRAEKEASDAVTANAPKKETSETERVVNEVTSTLDLIDWVANNLGVATKSKTEALKVAAKHNVTFPNL